MKKGFTLIEIISVIVILGIIGLIAIPVSNKIINNSKEKILTEQISRIVSACKSYVADSDEDLLPDEVEGSTKTISIDALRNNGYLNNKDLINPKTGNILTGTITITYTDNEYVYDYQVEENEPAGNGSGNYVYFQQDGEFTSLEQTTSTIPTQYPAYLKIEKNDITKRQACITNNGKEFCLNPNEYETSKQKILDYFGYDANTWTQDPNDANVWLKTPGDNTIGCAFRDFIVGCDDSVVGAYAYSSGGVSAYDWSTGFFCGVGPVGSAACGD